MWRVVALADLTTEEVPGLQIQTNGLGFPVIKHRRKMTNCIEIYN